MEQQQDYYGADFNIDDYRNSFSSFDEKAYANYKQNANKIFEVQSFGLTDEVIPEGYQQTFKQIEAPRGSEYMYRKINPSNQESTLPWLAGYEIEYPKYNFPEDTVLDDKDKDRVIVKDATTTVYASPSAEEEEEEEILQKNFGERFSEAIRGTYDDLTSPNQKQGAQNRFEYIFVRNERWKYNLFLLMTLVVLFLLLIIWTIAVFAVRRRGHDNRAPVSPTAAFSEYDLMERLLLSDNVNITLGK